MKQYVVLLSLLVLSGAVSAEVVSPVADESLPKGAVAKMGTSRFHHPGGVTSLLFSPDGKKLVSSGFAKTALWDFASGRALLELPTKQYGDPITFSPDGARVVSGGEEGWLFVWDAQSVTR